MTVKKIDSEAASQEQGRASFRFVAPALELSQALKAVRPIAVPGDSGAQFDSVRITVSEDSMVTCCAANPMMMGAAEVHGIDVLETGQVDIAPRIAGELADVIVQKVTPSGPVEAMVSVRGDFIEVELIYGLPICTHRTRRPTQAPRQPLDNVVKHIADVLQEVYNDEACGHVARSEALTRATPAQELVLQKSAKAMGTVLTRFPSLTPSKFVGTAAELAIVWVCNPDGEKEQESADLEVVEAQEDTPAKCVIVNSRPLGGVS